MKGAFHILLTQIYLKLSSSPAVQSAQLGLGKMPASAALGESTAISAPHRRRRSTDSDR